MHQFDQDIALTPTGLSLFEGTISPNWSINGIPNGGYLMALMTGAMMRVAEKTATPIVTVNYLARCVPGSITVSVEKIASSRQFDRLEARLSQEGKVKLRAFGTFADEKLECFLKKYESVPPATAPPENCVRVPALPGYTLIERMDIRLDPATAGWMSGTNAEKSEQRGWIRFMDSRPFDPLALLLIADSFPPAVFASQGPLAWVPTIEFNVSVRERASTPWLRCRFSTRFINCGLIEEDGEIWDGEGELVALSRQTAQFRPVS